MEQTKKTVHGTQYALDKAIERYKADGWTVDRTEKVPRGTASKKFTYVAYLRRMKLI